MSLSSLTIFTPTYNRAHTLARTYNSLCRQTYQGFEWLIIDDGSTDNTQELVYKWIKDAPFKVNYIYKENKGLYSGYNEAYTHITTELCVCIDSDDFMPFDAVETILTFWAKNGADKYAGIIGLDYFSTGAPIGGMFPPQLKETHLLDLSIKGIHRGDTKQVMRTDLMKRVAPMKGYKGEKNFNPIYLLLKIDNDYPLLVLNKNLCYVEYQENDSMSKNIFRQYLDSPRSFAELRRLEMTLKHSTRLNNMRVAIHYVASCLIAKEKNWVKTSPRKWLTISLFPLGFLLHLFIKFKAR